MLGRLGIIGKCSLCCYLLFLPYWARAAEQGQIGFVLSVSGRWTYQGRPLGQGAAVYAGSVITPSSRQNLQGKSHPSIVVILFDGTHLVRECATPITACARNPLEVPSTISARPSLADKLLAIGARLFLQQPDRYFEAMSRSGSLAGSSFTDAVVQLHPGSVDFTPFFRKAIAGPYRIDVRPLGTDSRIQVHGSHSLAVVWDGERSVNAPATGLRQGLYDVDVFHDEADDQDEVASGVWLLVVDENHFLNAASAYATFLSDTESLESALGAGEARALARAGLVSLASELVR